MIHPDPVQPISPIYHSEQDSGGELATRASGDGDGGDTSQTEGELVEGPEEVQAQKPMPSPVLPSQSVRRKHRITHLPYRSWCDEIVEAFGR